MSLDPSSGYGTFIFSMVHGIETPQLPVVYRCMLMCDAAGNIRGLKLGEESPDAVVIETVLNETVSEICQVTPGDVVTHINGVAVEGSLVRVRNICASSDSIAELRLIRRTCVDGRAVMGSACSLDSSPVFFYEVHPRDSLARIATIFQVSQQQIRQDNRESFLSGEKGYIFPGMWLKIRNIEAKVSTASAEEQGQEGLSSRRCMSGGSLSSCMSGGSSGDEGSSPPRRRVIEVEEGDTLERIAQRHGMTVMDLRRHNRKLFPVGEPACLYEGMRLVVYESSRQQHRHAAE